MWEYLVIEVVTNRPTDAETRLANLGREGWELVGVGSFCSVNTLYLKRALKG